MALLLSFAFFLIYTKFCIEFFGSGVFAGFDTPPEEQETGVRHHSIGGT